MVNSFHDILSRVKYFFFHRLTFTKSLYYIRCSHFSSALSFSSLGGAAYYFHDEMEPKMDPKISMIFRKKLQGVKKNTI